MALTKLMKLQECAELLGIPASTLRAEIHAGRLPCVRARPSCNAPILVSADALERWVTHVAGKRQTALSPTQAKAGNEAANPGANGDVPEAS
jgi:excisionase family DNA binding protein